jgi:hypothetical protein
MQTSNFSQKETNSEKGWMESLYESAKSRYQYNNQILHEIFYSTPKDIDMYGKFQVFY